MSRRIAWLTAIVFVAALSAAAQGFWAKKDWKKWSADECKKMTQDSPWAQRWAQSTTQTAQFSTYNHSTGQGTGGGGAGDESSHEVWYIAQLRSSVPIRAAIVRQQEIQIKYDSLPADQRAKVDQQAEGILGRKFDDSIVLHVYYGSNVQVLDRKLAEFWQTSYPPGTVPQDAYLTTEAGKRISPIHFIAPKGGSNEFELIFPRMVDGELLIEASSKMFSVEFHSPQIQDVPSGRVFLEFKPEKMQFEGALTY